MKAVTPKLQANGSGRLGAKADWLRRLSRRSSKRTDLDGLERRRTGCEGCHAEAPSERVWMAWSEGGHYGVSLESVTTAPMLSSYGWASQPSAGSIREASCFQYEGCHAEAPSERIWTAWSEGGLVAKAVTPKLQANGFGWLGAKADKICCENG